MLVSDVMECIIENGLMILFYWMFLVDFIKLIRLIGFFFLLKCQERLKLRFHSSIIIGSKEKK